MAHIGSVGISADDVRAVAHIVESVGASSVIVGVSDRGVVGVMARIEREHGADYRHFFVDDEGGVVERKV